MSKPFVTQRRVWYERVCANVDCRTPFATAAVTQRHCTPNCRYRDWNRRRRFARRAAEGREPTHLERLLAAARGPS